MEVDSPHLPTDASDLRLWERTPMLLSSPVLNTHELLLNAAGDPSFAGSGDHVDFAADAEFGQINSRLDGEAGVGQDAADVMGFEVVEVRAGAVDLVGDVVAGAVSEE